MHKLCHDEDPEAHFCSVYEIEHAWSTTGVYSQHPFDYSWVSSPYTFGTLTLSSTTGRPIVDSTWENGDENCYSWESENNSHFANIVTASANDLTFGYCSDSHAIACCKWVP